jgi:hypothetical protein
MTPAPAALAATAPQELVAAIDDQSATLAAAALMKSALDDPGKTPEVAKVADNKQEWEICDTVGKRRRRWSTALLGTVECHIGAQI